MEKLNGLIGSAIRPLYSFAVRVGFGAALIAHIVLAGLGMAAGGSVFSTIARAVQSLATSSLTMMGAMTLMALFVERYGMAQRLEKSKALMSMLEFAQRFERKVASKFSGEVSGPHPTLRSLAVLGLVLIGILALYLSDVHSDDYLVPTSNLSLFALVALILVVAQAAISLPERSQRARTQAYAGIKAAVVVGRLGVLLALLNNGPLFEVRHLSDVSRTVAQHVNQQLNIAIDIGLVAAIAITAFECVRAVIRIVNARRRFPCVDART